MAFKFQKKELGNLMLPFSISLATLMCGKWRNNLCSLLLLQQIAISIVGKLMGHHSSSRNEMLLKHHKVINNALGGSKRKS